MSAKKATDGGMSEAINEPLVTETEMRLISWFRYLSGPVAYLEAMTESQRQALEAFVRAMRESGTVH